MTYTTSDTTITILVENTAADRGMISEHGLAYWIQRGETRILFDTGAGTALFHNAAALNIDLNTTSAIAISHGHYDHTGGLIRLLEILKQPVPVYLHPDALQSKYSGSGGHAHPAGMTENELEAIKSMKHRLVFTECVTEIASGIYLTGKVPRITDYEDTGGPFFLDAGLTQPDPLDDDQSLYFDTDQGTVVLLGCAHAGVINTLKHIQHHTAGRNIHTCCGGMHLESAGEYRLAQTIIALKNMNIRKLGPMHCTGIAATVRLWTDLPGRCIDCHTGSILR